MMKSIEVYKTTDGTYFEDYRKAADYQEDLIGAALDELMPDDPSGNVTRSARHNLLMQMLKDEGLLSKVEAVAEALRGRADT